MNAPVRTRSRPQTPPDAGEAPVATVAPEVQGVEGFIDVERIDYNGAEPVTHRETIRVPAFKTRPAEVEVSGGVTRNQGNYNSARVHVTVRLPCYPERSEMDRAYNLASQLVDQWLEREVNIATGVETPGSYIDGSLA